VLGEPLPPPGTPPTPALTYDNDSNTFAPSVLYTDGSSAVSEFSVRLPGGSIGDTILVVVFVQRSNTTVAAFAPGAITPDVTAPMSGGGPTAYLYRLLITGTFLQLVATFTDTTSGLTVAASCSAMAIAITGADSSGYDSTPNFTAGTGTSAVAPTQTPTGSNASNALVTFFVALTTASGALSAPTGMTERRENTSSDGGTNIWNMSVDTQALSSTAARTSESRSC
jgi:hypothetical protein